MIGKTGPEVIKHFFMLNSAEHENFSANKYENANYSLAEKFSCSAMFLKKEFAIVSNLQLLVIWDLFAGQNSCSAELSMKKVL